MDEAAAEVRSSAKSRLPYYPALWHCLKTYNTASFQADLVAGIIVGIVALPLSIALAIAVGAPPQSGLYTAIVGGVVVAAFGGSRCQVSGPTAAFIVILSPICANFGLQGLMVAGLMAGVFLILMGISGLGSLIKYVPYPVTTGFTAGIAVTIGTIQLKDLFGLQTQFERVREGASLPLNHAGVSGVFTPRAQEIVNGLPDHFHEKVHALYTAVFHTPGNVMAHTTVVGLLTIGVLVAYPKLFPRATKKVPAPLVALLAAIAANQVMIHALNWADVQTIGMRFREGIPRGLPAFNRALFTEFEWSYANVSPLVMPAIAIATLGAIESLLSAVVADGMAGTKHDSNTELIGQGLGNIMSPLFGGIAATGAIARTATNIRNGGRTPVASICHAVVLVIIMLAAAPYAVHIPMAALAAILLVVAYNMAEIKHFKHLLSAPRSDVLVLFACFLLTVFMDMTIAVMAGMILAALLFMRRMAALTSIDMLDSVAGDSEMQSYEVEAHDIPRSVTIYNVDGPFFFGAAEKAINAIDEIGEKTRAVILRLNHVPAIDATGLYALEKCYETLRSRGIELILSGVRKQPREVMENGHFLERVGAQNVTPDIEWALVRCYEILGPAAQERHTGKTTVLPKFASK